MQLYLLVIDDLLIIRNETEKPSDIYWDLPYPLRHCIFGKCALYSLVLDTQVNQWSRVKVASKNSANGFQRTEVTSAVFNTVMLSF